MTDITFFDTHQPILKTGRYRVHGSVSLDKVKESAHEAALDFTVGGPLQPMSPAQMGGMFPPPGAVEDHTEVLPHIVLNEPTAPWSRLGPELSVSGPWLALLVVWESDGAPIFNSDDGPLETVTLPGDALNRAAPLKEDLTWLAHVRVSDGVERAVVLGGRLPMPGGRTTCMLVDIRGLYGTPSGGIVAAGPQDETVTVLHRWAFSSLDDKPDFATRMTPIIETAGPLRHPKMDVAAAETLAAEGFAVLPQHTRDGGSRATLYRGPFSGARTQPAADRLSPDQALTADALLEIDADTGLMDATYAAAWQIGRLIGLASEAYATALAQHRRSLRRRVHLNRSFAVFASNSDLEPPDLLAQTLSSIAKLDAVPFAYLVPDPDALPSESLRVFSVDPHWVTTLVAGAESLGRGANDPSVLPELTPPVCGLFLRSGVVRDFPGLVIEGVVEGSETVVIPEQRRLGPDTLLVLFDTHIDHVDMYLHPEALHHGTPNPLVIKNPDGTPSGATPLAMDQDSLWHGPQRGSPDSPRKPNFTALAQALSATGSGALALQLVEPSHSVRITFK
ncbi:MAG: hypothetical protein AB8B47_12400 [Roseobacter sp.]